MDAGPLPVLVTVVLPGAEGTGELDCGRHSVDSIPVVGKTFSVELDGTMKELRATKIEAGDHDSPIVHAEPT